MSASNSRDESTTRVIDAGSTATDGEVEEHAHGSRLSRYLVLEEAGRGGMGVVLRGYDPKLQREVALKLVRTDRLDTSGQARLVREARAMAQVNHPHVVAVYDVVTRDASEHGVVLVMEYVRGATLRAWLEAEPRTQSETLRALVAAGRGLAAAHAKDLLHRDFKLDNVLIGDDGRVRVTDFGLARARRPGESQPVRERSHSREVVDPTHGIDDAEPAPSHASGVSAQVTEGGLVVGTPMYMPPEQIRDDELDARADQYAFCVAAWRALTGQWPFEGSGTDLLSVKQAGLPRWPADAPPVPHSITQALRRGLDPDPAARWPRLDTLLAELDRNPTRRRRAFLAVAGVAMALGGILGVRAIQRARLVDACGSEGSAIAEVWNDDRATAITEAIAASGIGYASDTWIRSRSSVEAYASNWSALRVETCMQSEVERTLSAATATAARTCLDARRYALDALLEQLEAVDEQSVNAMVTATAQLPQLEPCRDPIRLRLQSPLPPDPWTRQKVQQLQQQVRRVRALMATGRYAAGLEQAEAALERARTLQWAPAIAQARLEVAAAYEAVGRFEDAREAAQTTYFEAGAAGLDELALRAATELVYTVGHRLSDRDEGLQWGRAAQMLIERIDAPDTYTALLLAQVAVLHNDAGDHARARDHYERALVMFERALGPEHPRVATTRNNLANAMFGAGEHDEALAMHRRVLALRQEALGPSHPYVASTLANLGTLHYHAERYEEARALHESAVATFEDALGPDHADVGKALTNLASVDERTGKYGQAWTRYMRALEIREHALGPNHPDLAYVLLGLVNVALEKGDAADAVRFADRAVTLRERSDLPPALLGEARFALARALRARDETSARAVTLAQEARDAYRQAGDMHATELASVERWLAAPTDSSDEARKIVP